MKKTQDVFRRSLADAVFAALTPQTVRVARQLDKSGHFIPLVKSIFPGADQDSSTDRKISRLLNDKRVDAVISEKTDAYQPPKWMHSYVPGQVPEKIKNILSRTFVTAIGCGPTTLFPVSSFIAAGVSPKNTIGITTNKTGWGGMWIDDPKGAGVVFNNPLPLELTHGGIRDQGEQKRSGDRMRGFLRRIAEISGLAKRIIPGKAQRIVSGKNGYHVILENGRTVSHTTDNQVGADIIFVGTGNEPKPLISSKMVTNAADFEAQIHRWQKPLTKEEAIRLNNKVVLIVGLGNSTLRQISFVEEANAKFGTNIKTVVLTHFTSTGLYSPSTNFERADGSIGKVARIPSQGGLTRLELDLKKSERQYTQYRDATRIIHQPNGMSLIEQGILPSVVSWHIHQDTDAFSVVAEVSQSYETGTQLAGKYHMPNIGAIYVLGGYHTDPKKLEALGFTIVNGRAHIRGHDGAAINQDGSINTRMYLTGFPGTTEKALNAGTMPGSMARIPDQLLPAILYALSKEL